jgi:hypothetical protein
MTMALMTGQLRKTYWRERRHPESQALLDPDAGVSFPCAAERFAVRKLRLKPTRIWEDEIDAWRNGRRYEIRQRRAGDKKVFDRLDLNKFDVLVVCQWTVGEGARGSVHLHFECKLLTADNIRREGTAKLNALLTATPTRIKGKAMVMPKRKVEEHRRSIHPLNPDLQD